MRFVLALTLPLIISMPAGAQTDAQKLAGAVVTFAANPEHRKVVTGVAIDIFKKLQQCDAGNIQSVAPPEVFGPLTSLSIDAQGNLTAGVIKEAVMIFGCGKQRIENILTVAANGQLKSVPGLPGASKADPILARDSMQYAYMGVARKIGQCRDVRVIDTKFDEFEGPPNPRAKFQNSGGRPWRETWTVNACGTLLDTDIHYIPDETGTGIQSVSAPP